MGCRGRRSACPTRIAAYLLRALFKCSRFSAKKGKRFACEMQRTGQKNRIWLRPGKLKGVRDRRGRGAGECRSSGRNDFRDLSRLRRAFTANLWKQDRIRNWNERFTNSADILV